MDERPVSSGNLMLICSVIVVIALIFFVTSNGERGGAKKVAGDADLPQITSPVGPQNTGSR